MLFLTEHRQPLPSRVHLNNASMIKSLNYCLRNLGRLLARYAAKTKTAVLMVAGLILFVFGAVLLTTSLIGPFTYIRDEIPTNETLLDKTDILRTTEIGTYQFLVSLSGKERYHVSVSIDAKPKKITIYSPDRKEVSLQEQNGKLRFTPKDSGIYNLTVDNANQPKLLEFRLRVEASYNKILEEVQVESPILELLGLRRTQRGNASLVSMMLLAASLGFWYVARGRGGTEKTRR